MMMKSTVSPTTNFSSVLHVEQGLVDVSAAENATEALFALAQALQAGIMDAWHDEVDVNTGYISLAPAQIRRIAKLLEEAGKPLGVLFSQVPQTQQSALGQGFTVREKAVIRPPRQVVIQESLPLQVLQSEEVTALQTLLTLETSSEEGSLQDSPTPLEEMGIPALEVQLVPVEGLYECEALNDEIDTEDRHDVFSENKGIDHLALPTKIIKGNLRSGRFEAFAGHLVIVGDVHTGAEIRVQGDVLVWGELRGLVHAGFKGSRQAEVRALKLDAVQIRIADIMARRPDRYTQLPTAQEPWKAPQGSFFPEIARVSNGEIQIYTTRRHAN
ncbi:MAG: hypothetical protein HEQ32_04155 [Vampirovibrio sp.]